MRLYHVVMWWWHWWRIHRMCDGVRAFLRSRGDNYPYTDEAIVEGFLRLSEETWA